jgi:extracellular factor (EF) 3-hydroxypalmitic acid methyl ester biosynthesis protein
MSHAALKTAVSPAALDLVTAAQDFSDTLTALDRRLRRAQIIIPPPEARDEVARAFVALGETMDAVEAAGGASEAEIRHCREIVGRWLFRSRIWNRAFHKPHGYAGDFMVIEWMYDLETDDCSVPFQPAIVNCLDNLGKHVDSITSLWERRRWYADLLRREHARCQGRLRVLDVAGGGARYIRDFLDSVQPGPAVEITVLDQDAAATAFCRTQSLKEWPATVALRSAPIRDLPALMEGSQFDVIISAGLFDYLSDPTARALLAQAAARLAPGGTVAITNYHPADRSRLVKDWLVDWKLVYRGEADCARLFPAGLRVETTVTSNGALVLATGTRPSAGAGEG